uniref:Uncharacterized protein n=1 Tax=Arundo donax TaxID=35708 RepID=A0A0A9GZ73_ARUDO
MPRIRDPATLLMAPSAVSLALVTCFFSQSPSFSSHGTAAAAAATTSSIGSRSSEDLVGCCRI